MYAVTKNRINSVKTSRRGIAQNYEKFDPVRDLKKNPNSSDNEIIVPKPVFQTSKKQAHYLKTQQQQLQQQTEVLTPQHEELVKYMNESWRMVIAENPYDAPNSPNSTSSTSSLASNSSSSSNSIYYVDQPSPLLKDFQPFDLETWWGKRLFNNITKNL